MHNRTGSAIPALLRWSGSKAKLVGHLRDYSPSTFARYVEPFAGSACLFFNLQPGEAILGDLNEEVVDLYKAVREDAKGVHSYLQSIPLTSEGYYKVRELQPSTLDLPQRAARLIFLMKACFNGVYRTNRLGRFNVPMGSRIYALPSLEQLARASQLLGNTTLIAGDFATVLSMTRTGDFVYLDPPYPQQGRYRGEFGYFAKFGTEDIGRLIKETNNLSKRGVYVMLSYPADDHLIRELKGWSCYRHDVQRTVAAGGKFRRHSQEVVLTNYQLLH